MPLSYTAIGIPAEVVGPAAGMIARPTISADSSHRRKLSGIGIQPAEGFSPTGAQSD
jgi:hypothetical protein